MTLNTALVRRLVHVAIFLTAFATYTMRIVNGGGLREPPESGDGHDYDAIAYNVWQGRGFGYHWSDEEWRKPYEGIPRYRPLLSRQSEYYPTTYRPPGMPLLLSGVYALMGRNFAAWRIVNCGIMAGAVTAASAIATTIAGPLAAVLTAAITLQSRDLTRYAGMFMTEPLATLMAALLTLAWVRQASSGWTVAGSVAAGVVMGGLLAARTIFVLSAPILAILPGRDRSSGCWFAWKPKAICLAVVFAVISPWWIRNVIVLDAFMPLGTQGGINLPMAFGPRALRFEGVWHSNPEDGWSEIAAQKLDTVTSEVKLAQYRQKLTIDWMLDNPRDVVRLMWLHVSQELRPGREFYTTWLLPLAAVGALVLFRSPGAWTVVLVVCANVLGIAMTYSAHGRFMVPMQPLLVALLSAGLVSLVLQAWTLVRPASAPRPRASA